jgi:hypothetical protein
LRINHLLEYGYFSQDTWILFPWDADSQFAEPIISRR